MLFVVIVFYFTAFYRILYAYFEWFLLFYTKSPALKKQIVARRFLLKTHFIIYAKSFQANDDIKLFHRTVNCTISNNHSSYVLICKRIATNYP